MSRSIEELRGEIWVRAWLAVATAGNCVYKDSAARWADDCLKEFDKRFVTPQGDGE